MSDLLNRIENLLTQASFSGGTEGFDCEQELTDASNRIFELEHQRARDKQSYETICNHRAHTLQILETKLAQTYKDLAFYRACALSGEVPTEGSQPSAIKPSEMSDDE